MYEGMLVIQERDANNIPTVTYTRGLDLSGGKQGAGGIGGLLARTDHQRGRTDFYHCDATGNITAMVDELQLISARYLYEPFGNIIAAYGPIAHVNTLRFSSKELHASSGLYYYGFRFYDPNLQRWINPDPLQEFGGINLHRFAGNDPINKIDPYGLFVGVDDAAVVITVAGAGATSTASAGGAGVTVTVAAGGTATGIGAAAALPITATFAAGSALGYGIGHYTGFHDWLAEKLVPDPTANQPQQGHILNPNEWIDSQGNVRDTQGHLVRDKNGNSYDSEDQRRQRICLTGNQPRPPLQRIHPDSTLENDPTSSLNYQRMRSTQEIVDSLRPGQPDPLLVRPDGRIVDGNTRIMVLQERGYDVNSLPRTIYDPRDIHE